MTRFRLCTAALAACVSSLAVGEEVHAQALDAAHPTVRVEAGVTAALAVGDFRHQVDGGAGFSLSAHAPLGPSKRLAARLDLSALTYGRESRQVCMRPGAGCRVQASEITTNDIFTLAFGPEFILADGWIQPYLHAFGGFSIYATQSGLGSWDASIPYFGFATSTNQRDTAFTWGGGGGVRINLPIESRPIGFLLGARLQRSGEVDYLRKGDLVDLPDGSYRMELQRGRTDFIGITMGGSVGFTFPGSARGDG